MLLLGGPPHPVIVTIRDNRDYIKVLLYSYYTTITGWGVLLMLLSCHVPMLLHRYAFKICDDHISHYYSIVCYMIVGGGEGAGWRGR